MFTGLAGDGNYMEVNMMTINFYSYQLLFFVNLLLVNSVVFAWYLCILTGLVVTFQAGDGNYMGVNMMSACMTINFYFLLISHTLSDHIP